MNKYNISKRIRGIEEKIRQLHNDPMNVFVFPHSLKHYNKILRELKQKQKEGKQLMNIISKIKSLFKPEINTKGRTELFKQLNEKDIFELGIIVLLVREDSVENVLKQFGIGAIDNITYFDVVEVATQIREIRDYQKNKIPVVLQKNYWIVQDLVDTYNRKQLKALIGIIDLNREFDKTFNIDKYFKFADADLKSIDVSAEQYELCLREALEISNIRQV